MRFRLLGIVFALLSNSEKRGTEQAPFVIKELPAEQSKEKTESAENKANQHWYDGWGLSDKLAVIASTVAFLQFSALMATFEVMRRTARKQLQAYVCLFGGSITLKKLEQNMFLEGYVSLKTSGQTPACDHSCWIRIDVRDKVNPPFDIGGAGLTRAIIALDGGRHAGTSRACFRARSYGHSE